MISWNSPASQHDYNDNNLGKKLLLSVFVIFMLAALLSFGYILYNYKKNQISTAPIAPITNAPAAPHLSPTLTDSDRISMERGVSAEELKAEKLFFSNFYENKNAPVSNTAFNYKLPINIKIDVSNYYDVSRKIAFDQQLAQLNKNGFAIMPNISSSDDDNSFYETYHNLSAKKIPILVTSDFMVYIFQNTLKEAYKDIETDVFYKEVWQIAKRLFEQSDSKYRMIYKSTGQVNDPVLEGLRKEVAFFAVALELLKPKTEQVDVNGQNTAKFSGNEANEYYFTMPEYLTEDAKNELSLINEASKEADSPIFLYQRDYKDFSIPEEYQANAKLNNFYLAKQWFNSVFPLYYRGEKCSNCLLDQYDWRINLMAASSIANDFSNDQETKNKWAKIYKAMSFFNGLRGDLTYLNYRDALLKQFGGKYKLDEIFSNNNKNRDKNLGELVDRISSIKFTGLEGGFNRNDPDDLPHIGMRILQKEYWPDNYIIGQLTYPNTKKYLGVVETTKPMPEKNNTSCNGENYYVRCRGTSMDIADLFYPIAKGNSYYQENSRYDRYSDNAKMIREQLSNFELSSWHNNIYWVMMDVGKKLLLSYQNSYQPNWHKDDWRYKNINTMLGGWVNLKLPADKLVYKQFKESNLSDTSNQERDYIEPNSTLVNELIANNNMIMNALLKLEVIKDSDLAYLKLNKLKQDLDNIKGVIDKEVKNENLNGQDLKNIADLTKNLSTYISKEKTMNLWAKPGSKYTEESIKGVNLLLYVYQAKDGKKIISVGPVFNYQEKVGINQY